PTHYNTFLPATHDYLIYFAISIGFVCDQTILTMFKRQVLLECISALLILLFVYASLSKFLDFHTFYHEMDNQPLPNSWTPFLVWFIPCMEVAISVSL